MMRRGNSADKRERNKCAAGKEGVGLIKAGVAREDRGAEMM